MRHTKKQRELLYKAWNRGYLSDSKSYGAISEVTGLSRKQVSNWARYQIKKLGNKPRPEKSSFPLSSIFKDLHTNSEEQQSCDATHENPAFSAAPLKIATFDSMPGNLVNIPCHQKLIKEEKPSLQPVLSHVLPPLPELLLRKPTLRSTIPTSPVTFDDIVGAWLQKVPPIAVNLPLGYNSPSGSKHYIPNIEHHTFFGRIPCRLAPVSQWLLLNALRGVREVDDKGIEDLEGLTSARSIDIGCYLLSHGWKAKPAFRGIRYRRS